MLRKDFFSPFFRFFSSIVFRFQMHLKLLCFIFLIVVTSACPRSTPRTKAYQVIQKLFQYEAQHCNDTISPESKQLQKFDVILLRRSVFISLQCTPPEKQKERTQRFVNVCEVLHTGLYYKDGQCSSFYGCGARRNDFKTKEECENFCKP